MPAGSLQEVMRMLSDDIDEVEICFDETQVKFKLGEVEITSKLIDGSFPDYRQLIPKESEINVELKRDELVRITKLAALLRRRWEDRLFVRRIRRMVCLQRPRWQMS